MAKLRWLTIAEAAELAGVNVPVMRRRLAFLDEQMGGRMLRRNGRRIEVNPEALEEAFTIKPTPDDRRSAFARQLAEHERQLEQARKEYRELRRATAELEARVKAARQQSAPNSADGPFTSCSAARDAALRDQLSAPDAQPRPRRRGPFRSP